MFNFFEKQSTDFDRIDNAGGGNCGYYALMMGIIHLAKSHETESKMQDTIERWKSLDEDAKVDIDNALKSTINILDRTQNKELMYRLQKSLRKILAQKYILSIPEQVEKMHPSRDEAFAQFKFLVEQAHPGAERIRPEDRLANPLCQKSSQPVVAIAWAINEHLEKLKYPHNPKYQEIVHQEFIAASFICFRKQVIDAYQHHYVGSKHNDSHSWATEQCLVTLASSDCLNLPIQILTDGQPTLASILALNEMGVRLNNENNKHWTLYLPKHDASGVQAAVVDHNQEGNKRNIFDKRKDVDNQRLKWTSEYNKYLLEKEPNLRVLFESLNSQNTEQLDLEACDALNKQYRNLFALHRAHVALDEYMKQHGTQNRKPYDEQYLRLELQRCKYYFQFESTEELKLNLEAINAKIDQLRDQTIQEIRQDKVFQAQVANLDPKDVNDKDMPFNNNYPRYALNGCLGGLIVGGLIVGSSPELVAVTAAALSFSSIGAIFTLLLASMVIAIMLTLLTLYLIDKCTEQNHTMMNMF